MQSVGEVMAIGRTFKEALQKGIRSLEPHTPWRVPAETPASLLREKIATARPDRIHWLMVALERGLSDKEICELTKIDPWFIAQMREIIDIEPPRGARDARNGFAGTAARGEARAAPAMNNWRKSGRRPRPRCVCSATKMKIAPVFKRVDTCAAEFESFTPYMYSTYEEEDESDPTEEAEDCNSWAAAQTASGRELNLIIAAATRRLRCAKTATKQSC